MKKYLATSILASLVLAANSFAAVSINLSGNPNSGPQFFTGAGSSTVIPDGSLIRIGTFDAAPSAGAAFASYAGSFREFGRTTIGNATNVNPGTGRVNRLAILGGAAPDSPDEDASFVGKTIYIWVYNSASASSDPSVAQGVFATSLTFADQATALSTSITGYINAFGTAGDGGPAASVEKNANNLATRFNLAAVPEPTVTMSLGLLGALGLMRRRR